MCFRTSTITIRHGRSLINDISLMIKNGQRNIIPESVWEIPDRDLPLAREGEEEAQRAAPVIQSLVNGKRIYAVTSSYIRAIITAETVIPNADWLIDDRFRERDYGQANAWRRDPTKDELVQIEFQRSFKEPDFVPFENGETFRQTHERVRQALEFHQHAAAECGAEVIVISMHGETKRSVRTIAHDIQLEEYDSRLGGLIMNTHIDNYCLSCPFGSGDKGIWYQPLPPPYDDQPWQKIR